jgi:hypothetical protein
MRNEYNSSSERDFSGYSVSDGITFDPDTIVIQALYGDELSAYRAKKLWSDTLNNFFMLSAEDDFTCSIMHLPEQERYYLVCTFLTSNGRYAFWRITNYQAPEAQYIFETAHIPLCESRQSDILRAPDLRSIYDDPLLPKNFEDNPELRNTIGSAFKKILAAIKK